jgi:stearoyl-CoA desaturase (Delta-9 desaturase)
MSTDSIQRPAAARQGSDDAHSRSSVAGEPRPDSVRGEGTRLAGPTAEDVQPPVFENLDRFLTGLITVGPILALGFVGWQLWDGLLHGSDLVVFAIMYISTALGVTVGFHRLFTHRSFKTSPFFRFVFAVLGSAAIEGPVISWVADHRKHHAFSDREGDPHSPHVDHGSGLRGALKGLAHAHVGWLFIHTARGHRERYAPDLCADPVVSFVDKTFFVWAIGGLGVAFGLGYLIGGTLTAALTGLLWGGAVRMLLLHHVTYSINSLCHFFGRRSYETGDHSRNLAWLAPFSLGEAWHNNHHAFPTSAFHGFSWRQIDISALVIRGMEQLGLAWDVVRITPERRATKSFAA